jgi:hypothetical protein
MIRVYAAADLPVDHDALQRYLDDEVATRPQVYQGSGGYFGGWSVTSGTGDYRDGWQPGQHALKRASGSGPVAMDKCKFQQMFPVHPKHMRLPTELYRGPVEMLMHEIERRCEPTGVTPSRVRLSKLDANRRLRFHCDSPVEDWRIHVPITTNRHCFFEWDLDDDGKPDVRLHMPPGSAWFVRVDKLHRFVNNGTQSRVHLLMSLVSWREEMIGIFNSMMTPAA